MMDEAHAPPCAEEERYGESRHIWLVEGPGRERWIVRAATPELARELLFTRYWHVRPLAVEDLPELLTDGLMLVADGE